MRGVRESFSNLCESCVQSGCEMGANQYHPSLECYLLGELKFSG